MDTDSLIEALLHQFARLLARVSTVRQPPPDLTDLGRRLQCEVALALRAEGVTVGGIADQLQISPRTLQAHLKTHRERIPGGAARVSLRQRVIDAMCAERRQGLLRVPRPLLLARLRVTPERLSDVLDGLVSEGVLFGAGTGSRAVYLLNDEAPGSADAAPEADREMLVLMAVTRAEPVSVERLLKLTGLDPAQLESLLAGLSRQGAVVSDGGSPSSWSRGHGDLYVIDARTDTRAGRPPQWPLAVLDQLEAVVRMLCHRLAVLSGQDEPPAFGSGGSNYVFDVARERDGSALDEEVLRLLGSLRARCDGMRATLERRNREAPRETEKVAFYFGLTPVEPDA